MMYFFWIIILVAIVWAFRGFNGGCCMHGMRRGDRRSALDILKERYARGEIDKAEFDAKRKDLSE